MKKKIDWEFIQSEYQETDKSIRKIAQDNGVSEGAVRSRIKKHKWEKLSRHKEVSEMIATKSNPIRGEAAHLMREIIDILGDRYNPAFEMMIVIISENYAIWITLRNALKENGLVYVTSKGTKQIPVEFIMMKDVEKTIREFTSYIGLSMADIMQLSLQGKTDQTSISLSDIAKKASQRKIVF